MTRSKRKIRKNIISMLNGHRSRRHLVLGVLPVALILLVTVVWTLHLDAITWSDDPVCGVEEHTHTEECYEWVAVESSSSLSAGSGALTASVLQEAEEAASTVAASNPSAENVNTTEEESNITEEDTNTTEEIQVSYQEGDTKVVDGVTYVYILTCEQEEHTHTEECYETQSVIEGIMAVAREAAGTGDNNNGIALIDEDGGVRKPGQRVVPLQTVQLLPTAMERSLLIRQKM